MVLNVIGYGLVLFVILDVLFILWVLFLKSDSTWIKMAPYTVLVKETILYTGNILCEKKIKNYPAFKLCYYRHKKFRGLYNGEVIIYTKSNPDIESLIDSTLHEVAHYIQSRTDKQFKRYDEYTRTMGYWDNPYEQEARCFAKENLVDCLKYLESKQLIKKQ